MANKALSYLDSLDLLKVDLRLDRIEAFLKEIGNPQHSMKYVHVAGTNGKGSVCAFVSSALQEAGFKTGLYLSPHLLKFNERIQVNGEMISGRELGKLVFELKEEKEKSGIELTYFEFITALAFKHFSEKECDFVVLETGMGGRLDATNIIIPETSIITRIGFEHKKYLGHTIEQIAFEKAGIVKKGIPVISAPQEEKAFRVIREKCKKENSSLFVLDRDFSYGKKRASLKGQEFDYNSEKLLLKNLNTRMVGGHQFENAAIAVRALEELHLPEQAIRNGLGNAFLQGRFELIHNNPSIIIDVAHNPSGMRALRNSLQEFFPRKKALFVLGVSEDKDIAGIAKELSPIADSFVCTQAEFRGMSAEKIRQAVLETGFKGRILSIPRVSNATKKALSQKKPLTVFTGSFYSIGEAFELLKN